MLVEDKADIVHELVALITLIANIFGMTHELQAKGCDADETPA
jgi:hypothetical protein